MTLNADRWKRISDKYREVRRNGHEASFVAMRLAAHLRQELVSALGCPDPYVTFYRYEVGLDPSWDKSTKVDKAHQAITRGQNGLDFGLGITLEIGPDTHPKLTVVIPVNVVVGDTLSVETSLSPDRNQVRPQSYTADVSELAEKMYEGLGELLDKWIDGSGGEGRGIGFK